MWKKIFGGILLAVIIGLSYQRYQQINVYGVPRKFENFQVNYGEILGPTMLPKKYYDPQIQILKPDVHKIHVTGNSQPVIRINVPYRFSSKFPDIKGHQIAYSNNFGKHIRIGAGGTVWEANNYSETARINLKKRSTTGKVTFDLPIQDGYPEKALRNYQIYFIAYPSNTVDVYKIN